MADAPLEAPAPARSRLLYFLPVLLFGALALLFLVRLYAGDPSKVPSVLIGRPAPAFTLIGATLHLAGMRTEILRRRVRTLTILEAERLDAQAA